MVLENTILSGSQAEGRPDVWTCPASDFIYGGALFSAGSEQKTGGDLERGRAPGLGVLASPLSSCAILPESRHIDKPQFSHPENGNAQHTCMWDLMKPKLANKCDSLAPKQSAGPGVALPCSRTKGLASLFPSFTTHSPYHSAFPRCVSIKEKTAHRVSVFSKES